MMELIWRHGNDFDVEYDLGHDIDHKRMALFFFLFSFFFPPKNSPGALVP